MSMMCNKKIDAYFFDAEPFAREICEYLRELIHHVYPEVKEEWKWGPNFQKEGKMILGIGAFKKHVHLAFYHGASMKDKYKLFNYGFENDHNRSIKITSMEEIDEKKLLATIKEAFSIKIPETPKEKKTIATPPGLAEWLKAQKLYDYFESQSYSHRKEYIEWISSAKKEETRTTRLKKMKQMLKEKKGLNDKYK